MANSLAPTAPTKYSRFGGTGVTPSASATLTSSGEITQTGVITAPTLTLNGGGTYTLGSRNNVVTTLDVDDAALGGDLSFRDDGGFSMTGVDGGGNNVTLSTDGTETQTGL